MDEQERTILLRKYNDTLYISGTGTMILGVWSLVQLFLYFTVRSDELEALSQAVPGITLEMVYALIGILAGLEIFARFFVGFSARSVAIKGKKRIVYVILCFLIILWYVLMMYLEILSLDEVGIFSVVMSLVVYLTSMYICFEVAVTGIRIRRFL